MARILITSGPTRQFLDPVRFLSNSSSGLMGKALASAALRRKHEVVVVSGPVQLQYPASCEVVPVVTTEDMLEACHRLFPHCDGLIGAAAPCDYRPVVVQTQKISKTGTPLILHLEETPDVVATMGSLRQPHQWLVGFALETDDQRFRAITKMQKKHCDLMVVNGPSAMNSTENDVEILAPDGSVVDQVRGSKELVGDRILAVVQQRLLR